MKSRLAVEQATAALRAGNRGDAEWSLRRHLVEQPEDGAAIAKLAEIVLDEGRVEEATILLRRAAAAEPTPERQMALINHLQMYVGAEPVLAEIEALPQPFRDSFDIRMIEAGMHGHLGDHARQIAIYERLAGGNPGDYALWKRLGDTLKTVGRTEEAVAALRRSIEINPNFGEGWWTLANFKSFPFTDKHVAAMRKALRGRLSDVDALHFHFALGQAFEDRRQFAKSFQHYDAANALRRKSIRPEWTRITGYVDRAIATYTPELFDRHEGAGCLQTGPIFVLGLHRSGSTLVEQILGSHPMIESTTEITVMHQLWERIARTRITSTSGSFEELQGFDASDFAAIGEEYLDRAAAFRTAGRPWFVDKLPANWMYAGLIRLALPNARIVDARRHPLACGFSNFRQNYGSGIYFSYSLETIGAFYRDYWRFMSHVDAVQPGAVHRVINERLIDDPEGEARRLLDFIGVPFDPACLEFHKSGRAIGTPSAEQVRKGIRREGIDQWRNYEPWLGPLKDALGEALDKWDQA